MKREQWIERFGSYPHEWDDPVKGLAIFLCQSGFSLEHVRDLAAAYELTEREADYIEHELKAYKRKGKSNGNK